MTTKPGVHVTLSAAMYRHLKAEALAIGVPLEWLVASLVVDTVETAEREAAGTEPLAA